MIGIAPLVGLLLASVPEWFWGFMIAVVIVVLAARIDTEEKNATAEKARQNPRTQ